MKTDFKSLQSILFCRKLIWSTPLPRDVWRWSKKLMAINQQEITQTEITDIVRKIVPGSLSCSSFTRTLWCFIWDLFFSRWDIFHQNRHKTYQRSRFARLKRQGLTFTNWSIFPSAPRSNCTGKASCRPIHTTWCSWGPPNLGATLGNLGGCHERERHLTPEGSPCAQHSGCHPWSARMCTAILSPLI